MYKKENLPELITASNLKDVDPGEIKEIYRYPTKGGSDMTSVVIETSAAVRSSLLSCPRVYVGFAACRIEDHILVRQCFRCLKFGHIATAYPKESREVCGKCCGDHASRDCRGDQPLKCYNCSLAKYSNTEHSALDSSKCPVLIRKIEERARSIEYS